MDTSMPLVEGAATIAALRQIKAEIKVLVLSGHNQLPQTEIARTIKTND